MPDNLRLSDCNDAPLRSREDGASFVLYWMIAARRTRSSFALDRALARCAELDLPLVVFEPLRAGYPHASDRLHRVVLDGMHDNVEALRAAGIAVYPYVEPEPGAGRGLLEALAAHAAVVVTDEFPAFFLPRMVAAAADRLDVRLEAVDGNGLLPLRAAGRAFPTAHGFRRHLQRTLPGHLDVFPEPDPLADVDEIARGAELPAGILEAWPPADPALLDGSDPSLLAALPIDHEVGVVSTRGGQRAALEVLDRFIDERLPRYGDERNHPDAHAESGFSPYLHFGHLGAHEVVRRVLTEEDWSPGKLSGEVTGKRTGWWGVGESAEAFLDELVTWREVGFVFAHHRYDDLQRVSGLPEWAQTTLAEHADDARQVLTRATIESARTYDEVWNASQRELLAEGTLHNYLRMNWGKRFLEWTASPQDAFDLMVELNDRWALDGRDPNSYSGIGWVLGRFDRAWGPERKVFGKVRYMTSESTRRKLRMTQYLARYGDAGSVHDPSDG